LISTIVDADADSDGNAPVRARTGQRYYKLCYKSSAHARTRHRFQRDTLQSVPQSRAHARSHQDTLTCQRVACGAVVEEAGEA
jgi:hypothetical protein